MNIVLSGFGAVGQAATHVLMNKAKEWERTYGIHIKITAVLDRSGAVVHSSGLDLKQLLQMKAETGGVDNGALPREMWISCGWTAGLIYLLMQQKQIHLPEDPGCR
ncbi:hypothetical protein ACFOLK_15375 [Marinococcus halophilus]|uniref:hypothetical protein n=1 Tax=Marinococcus halophilus TaxID=1371 RepID=UPI003612B92A